MALRCGAPTREHQQCLFLSCGASSQLRGCTAACCSTDLHLQASWAQVTQGPHQPHQPPMVAGGPAESREAAVQTPEPSTLASGGRRGFAEGHRESQWQSLDEESTLLVPHLTPQAAGTGELRVAPQQRWGQEPGSAPSPAAGQGQSRFSLKTDPSEAGDPGPNCSTHKNQEAGRSGRAGKGLAGFCARA